MELMVFWGKDTSILPACDADSMYRIGPVDLTAGELFWDTGGYMLTLRRHRTWGIQCPYSGGQPLQVRDHTN